MSEINYQALRAKAEKATKGSYIVGHTSVNQHGNLTGVFVCQKWKGEPGGVIAECHVNCLVETDAQAYANAEFIAAANPATMLALLDELEAAEKRNAELQSENAYIRNRYKELDLLIGKNILVMQAAIIEWQATGDAKSGLAWIYNTLFGPGELPDESEKDAQAYFNRKYAPIDEKLMALHKWFWEQSEAERAAANIGVKGK
ncbi:ead/Ea22-like family protein [Salmonella enterica]|nr:ead/Ea22-like family protein [Salmonella enterica]ECS5890789.1 ead/Ea22-like family protein [Salmonella enterica subsp. enterica serovar Hadar]EDN4903348.1 ead/Ea22-like family protein [Salmonella enterica subsp. enterica serovar Saintpaul]EEL4718745.1 ead/Ea22-like family protein [Salmonella enterica subsp. enterica serovar Kentucky]EAN6063899.1 ead/Ea22-like family protein [Salmonella enterica]